MSIDGALLLEYLPQRYSLSLEISGSRTGILILPEPSVLLSKDGHYHTTDGSLEATVLTVSSLITPKSTIIQDVSAILASAFLTKTMNQRNQVRPWGSRGRAMKLLILSSVCTFSAKAKSFNLSVNSRRNSSEGRERLEKVDKRKLLPASRIAK